jgi:hypothetical protein
MIELVVHPSVLVALKSAFPKPPNAAEKALNNYVGLLEDLIFDDLIKSKDNFSKLFNLYSISLNDLMHKSPRLSSKKIRLHSWLQQNNLQLIKTIETGNSITKRISVVKLTTNVTLGIKNTASSPQKMFEYLHPNFNNLTSLEIERDYDYFDVDLFSLDRYLQSIYPSNRKPTKKDFILLSLARCIQAAAMFKNGRFYQKKSPKFFGRTYYEKLSVQNVNKDLRRAMLGDSWEYDIRSSVVSWKLGFAQDYMNSKNWPGTVASNFPYCHQYAIDKTFLINQLAPLVFPLGQYSPTEMKAKLKQAMTALNFGAKLQNLVHINNKGELVKGAMNKILKDEVDVKAFINCQIVKRFIAEQKALNEFIIEKLLNKDPTVLSYSQLVTKSGKPKPQVMLAYFYQHAEWEVMEEVKNIANQNNLTIIANIHDAIIFRDRLSQPLRDQMQNAMRIKTNNQFWHLEEKQISGY